MDLINWSLNAIDTIFSTRSLGSGEPDCPAGTFAAGYTMDAWDRWRVVCLAALSVEDIEDIYLFGTMITGLLLIGLGIALVYRGIKKTVTAVQSLTRLPVMIEAKTLEKKELITLGSSHSSSFTNQNAGRLIDHSCNGGQKLLKALVENQCLSDTQIALYLCHFPPAHHHEAWVLEPPWGRDLRKAWSRRETRDQGTAVGLGVFEKPGVAFGPGTREPLWGLESLRSLESPWGQGCGEIDPKFKPEE
ncbi:hypothetical protein F2P79_023871 [Pimephales promelas]|nr:hypothetical protein F2P79_023871 [Pimephales promelas]